MADTLVQNRAHRARRGFAAHFPASRPLSPVQQIGQAPVDVVMLNVAILTSGLKTGQALYPTIMNSIGV